MDIQEFGEKVPQEEHREQEARRRAGGGRHESGQHHQGKARHPVRQERDHGRAHARHPRAARRARGRRRRQGHGRDGAGPVAQPVAVQAQVFAGQGRHDGRVQEPHGGRRHLM